MNQAPTRNVPTEDKPHPYKQIKVGLINQAPTRNKSRQEVNRYINKVGLINQAPTRNVPTEDKSHPHKQIMVGLINQAPTRNVPT